MAHTRTSTMLTPLPRKLSRPRVHKGDISVFTGLTQFLSWKACYASIDETGLFSVFERNCGDAPAQPLLQAVLSLGTIEKMPALVFSRKPGVRLCAKLLKAKPTSLDRGGWIVFAGDTVADTEGWVAACVAHGSDDRRALAVDRIGSQADEAHESLLASSVPRSDGGSKRREARHQNHERRVKAARMLQRLVRKVLRKRVEQCAPVTFRTAPPYSGHALLADWGRVTFGGRSGGKPRPYFMHLARDRMPLLTQEQYTHSCINMLERHWGVGKASVVISITGSAQNFDMPPRLLKALKQGLVNAALATNALIVTGGTDSGVMQIAGKAIAEYDARVAVLGIATWGTVLMRHKLVGCRGEVSDLTPEAKNSKEGSNLEPNHTHFLLIDSEKEGSAAWGGEIAFRNAFEAEYCRSRRVSRVLVVVQGGPGTLSTVLAAVESECPVVLIADSGGVAELLHVFLQAYYDTASTHFKHGIIPQKFESQFRAKEEMLTRIAEANNLHQRITSFSMSQVQTAELDLHLLNAVIDDTAQCKPESRLKLAVEWNRVDVVKRVMHDGGELNTREAVQCAIMNQRVEIIKMLLAQSLAIVEELDVIELYRTLLYSERVFRNSTVLTELLESSLAYSVRGKPTTVYIYTTLLMPFLKDYFPGLDERCESTPNARKARLSVDDVFIWAVLIGNRELAEYMWLACGSTNTGDPIRLALLAAYASRKAAGADITEEARYLEHATHYEGWACAALSKCENHEDATWVLRRPSEEGWPSTLMHVATQTKCKQFVGHRFVQNIVDESFRGNMFGSQWALPRDTPGWKLLTHLVWPSIRMEVSSTFRGRTSDAFGTPVDVSYLSFWRTICQHFSHPSFPGFLLVPQVKFLLARLSYILYLFTYFAYIVRRTRQLEEGHLALEWHDWTFFVWTIALGLDEVHQWIDDARGGTWRSHFASPANVYDVCMWSVLCLANVLRACAANLCVPVGDPSIAANHTTLLDLSVAAVNEVRRQLRGGGGHVGGDDESDVVGTLTSDSALLYEGACVTQDVSHIILTITVIFAFVRPLDMLLVNRKFGVLSIIMLRLKDDILVFITYAGVFIVAFGSAFIGLMPTLGDGIFDVNGAFFVPFWSMYGEFGELGDVGHAGGPLGTILLWVYTFSSQIVLVNLVH